MKSVGVVVEYNPFHNGHAYHLNESKISADADVVIAVMSGNFLQRGEPALLPKWNRARMALLGGADVVVELPYQFATQKADTFARGAVAILSSLGCDTLSFGSESGNIQHFHNTLAFIEKNNPQFEENIKTYLKKGFSYPRSFSSAFLELSQSDSCVDMAKPNNILGLQYIKAVKDKHIPMKVITVPRTTSNYHDETFTSPTISSATSIRKALLAKDNEIENIKPYVPNSTYQLLTEFFSQANLFHEWESYWTYLRYRLLQVSPAELRNIYEIEEGIENRLITMAFKSESFLDFMSQVKTKRYTWTRLQRMCVHILTNTKKQEMEEWMEKATYIRLLGMTEKGRQYLHKRKGDMPIPLISKLSSFKERDIELDVRAAKIYALGAAVHTRQKLLQMEFDQPPIYLKQ